MESAEKSRLRYRRQYILSHMPLDCPFDHQKLTLNSQYELYAHVDLLVNTAEQDKVQIILLGDLFDYEFPEKGNQEILADLIDQDLHTFLEKIAKYAGKYVLIYVKDEQIFMVTDPIAAKKIYYCNWNGSLLMASQPHLLAKLLGLKKTTDESKLRYYQSDDYEHLDRANIGNTTYYDEIVQLIPNHFLDLTQSKSVRFWPNKKIEIRPVREVVKESAEVLRGYMKAIALRYKVMLPVTSGSDSRLLMAATKEIREDVFYYINRNKKLSDNHPDIKVPSKLFKKLNLDFHVLELEDEIDADFRTVYFENNPLATEKYLPHIYNYYKNFSDKVNLPGNFASSVLGIYELAEKNVNAATLASIFRFKDYDYAHSYFGKWLEESKQLCLDYEFSILRMLYQEERGANWMTQTQMDKEIAQEDINPFNSRKLISLFLAVAPKYRIPPEKRMNIKVTKFLWPELLSEPVNPKFRKRIMKLLARLNLLKYVYRIKYKTAR